MEIHNKEKKSRISITVPFGEKYKVVAFWHCYLFQFSLHPIIFQLTISHSDTVTQMKQLFLFLSRRRVLMSNYFRVF